MSLPVKGWKGKIKMNNVEVGDAQSVSINIDQDTDEYLSVGSLFPTAIVPGALHITGTIERAWVDTTLLSMFGTANSATTATPVLFHVYAYEQNAAGTGVNTYVYCWNCYSEKFSLDMPNDDFMKATIDFKAAYFTYG